MSKCRVWKKTTTEKRKFGSHKKLGLEETMNGLGKQFRNSDSKNRKNSKHQSEIVACEQKTTSEKANFLQCFLSTSKLEQKNFTSENH